MSSRTGFWALVRDGLLGPRIPPLLKSCLYVNMPYSLLGGGGGEGTGVSITHVVPFDWLRHFVSLHLGFSNNDTIQFTLDPLDISYTSIIYITQLKLVS